MKWPSWFPVGSHDRLMVILTSAIVLLTAGNVLISFWYASITNRSSRESAKQAERMICAANIQARAADSFSKTADRIDAKIGKTEEDFQAIAESSKSSANAVQGGLATTQQEFQLDRRPMIRIVHYELADLLNQQKVVHPQLNEALVVNIPFTNIGKTPALNLIAHYHLMFSSQASQFKIEPADGPNRVGEILEPGTDTGSFVTAVSLKDPYIRENPDVDPKQVIGWDGSDIYVFGRITYEDQIGTHYCLPYMQKLLSSGSWASISSFNLGQSKFLTTQLCPAHTRH